MLRLLPPVADDLATTTLDPEATAPPGRFGLRLVVDNGVDDGAGARRRAFHPAGSGLRRP